MDFADILIFGFILIPIVIKAVQESKKASQKQASSAKRTTYNTTRAPKVPNTTLPRDYAPHWKEAKYNQEVKPQFNNDEGYTIPEVSLESHGYNEEDYIKSGVSLESSEYIGEDSKDRHQTRISFRKDKIKDVIRDSEIGSEDNLSFDRSQLVQGIVMSEILSKPKSLRR